MKPTITKRIVLTAALSLGIFSYGEAFAAGFVRPSVWYVDYTETHLVSKRAASIAVGTAFGTNQNQELSLEIGRAPWAFDQSLGTQGLGVTGNGHIVPMLVNYRFYIDPGIQHLHAYVGGSVGVTKQSGRMVVALSGVNYAGDVDKTQGTFGATAGVTAALSTNVSLDIGYRYLHTDGSDSPSVMFAGAAGYTGGPGPKIHFPNTNAHVLSASVALRF